MLAHHLKRLAKPVRYAMDPAHEQAIRNYLAIASRAQDVPGLLRHNFMQTTPWTQQLGKNAPLAGELIQSFTGEHDAGALSGLLDLLDDHGFYGYRGQQEVPNLIHMLRQLHQNIAGHGHGQAGAHPAVLRGYGDDPELKRLLAPRVRPAFSSDGLFRDVANTMNSMPAHYRTIRDHLMNLDDSRSVEPMAAVALHDIMGNLAGDESGGQRHAAAAHRGLGRLLRDTIHPALWHFGEHGTLPQ